MFNNNVEPLENLIDQFAQFPGIGRKSAVRMAYQVMSMPPKQAMELAKAIEHAKSDLHRCRICQDYTTGDVCKICASQKRDRSIICVVEGPRDIKSIERTHEYNGLYHVLHGLISPMDGIGADQLCIKELLARVKALLRRSSLEKIESEPEDKITAGDLIINNTSREVYMDGKPVFLSLKEFELLYLLASHRNRVFTREQLLELIWGYEYSGETRTVDVHVRNLRKKIEKDPDHPQYIQTVRGMGYKFV